MPTRKEMRLWLIGAIVGAWGLVVWMIIDHFIWLPEGVPVEQIHQIGIKVRVLGYGVMFVVFAGVLLITRAVYFMLREMRENGEESHRY